MCMRASQHFRRVPYKFLINVALVVLSTLLIFDINANLENYERTSNDSWNFLLAPATQSVSTVGNRNVYHLYTLADLTGTVCGQLFVDGIVCSFFVKVLTGALVNTMIEAQKWRVFT